MKLELKDLVPTESSFALSGIPGKTFVLKRFSLRAQAWMTSKFSTDQVKHIFMTSSMPEVSEIVHFLLKDKSEFKSVEDLQEEICTQDDRIAVMTALLETIGISQPIIKQLSDDMEAEEKKSHPLTGQSTTTELHANTDIQSISS